MVSLYVCSCNKTKNSHKSNVFHTSRLYDVNKPECIQGEQTFAVGVSLDSFRNCLFKPNIIQVSEAACQAWLINHTHTDLVIGGSCSLYGTLLSCHGVVPAPLSLPSTQMAIVKPTLSSLTHLQWLSTYSLPYPQSDLPAQAAVPRGRHLSAPTL